MEILRSLPDISCIVEICSLKVSINLECKASDPGLNIMAR